MNVPKQDETLRTGERCSSWKWKSAAWKALASFQLHKTPVITSFRPSGREIRKHTVFFKCGGGLKYTHYKSKECKKKQIKSCAWLLQTFNQAVVVTTFVVVIWLCVRKACGPGCIRTHYKCNHTSFWWSERADPRTFWNVFYCQNC